MVILVTGGAGFIGRWVVKQLLLKEKELVIIDNFSNGKKENLAEFRENPSLIEIVKADIRDKKVIDDLFFKYRFSICIHLAAQIHNNKTKLILLLPI